MTRIMAPRVIRLLAADFSLSALATCVRPVSSIVISSPDANIARTIFGVADKTAAALMPSLSGCSANLVSIAASASFLSEGICI